MVLAEQRMIPRVFAAVARAVSAVRTLVCYGCGAVGPGKDCGYENPILKAITGFPMAMEGKTAACAHPSPLGNIGAATCGAIPPIRVRLHERHGKQSQLLVSFPTAGLRMTTESAAGDLQTQNAHDLGPG
jgi:Methanol-cobalamin methyltransferase B subunit